MKNTTVTAAAVPQLALPQLALPAARRASPGRRRLGRLGHRCCRCCGILLRAVACLMLYTFLYLIYCFILKPQYSFIIFIIGGEWWQVVVVRGGGWWWWWEAPGGHGWPQRRTDLSPDSKSSPVTTLPQPLKLRLFVEKRKVIWTHWNCVCFGLGSQFLYIRNEPHIAHGLLGLQNDLETVYRFSSLLFFLIWDSLLGSLMNHTYIYIYVYFIYLYIYEYIYIYIMAPYQ